jgi:RNA polymerase sigma factor (sigma-70 family)
MNADAAHPWTMAEGDRALADTFVRQRERLRAYIRRRVPDAADAEDILQDVFFELTEATRLMRPIEQVGAWLYRVARNRIVDAFRRRKAAATVSLDAPTASAVDADGTAESLLDLLPSEDAGPDAAFARQVLLEELDAALDELPEAQRSVFLAHEIEGLSFKEISRETGVSVATLLSRKHYAVQRLRRRLQAVTDTFLDQGA